VNIPFTRRGRYGPRVAHELTIRPALEGDVEAIFGLIQELAAYEKLADQVSGDAETLRRELFEAKTADALLAEVDGEAVGYALICGTFSTFECRAGIWIEDIYVRPPSRKAGVGRALFARIAALAVERDWPRVEWAALEWNELALDFYAGLGAEQLDEWRMLRLDGEALAELGRSAAA
jgi:GNAT superfamily N-acetyltransferase